MQPKLERVPTVATAQEEQNVIVHCWHTARNYKKCCSILQYQRKILSLQTKQLQHPAHSNHPAENRGCRGRPVAEGLPAAKCEQPQGHRAVRTAFCTHSSTLSGDEGLWLGSQELLCGLQLPSPEAESKHTACSAFRLLPMSLLPNVSFHSVLGSIKPSPLQSSALTSVTCPPLTPSIGFNSRQVRGSQASANIRCCSDGCHLPFWMVNSCSAAYQQNGTQVHMSLLAMLFLTTLLKDHKHQAQHH